LVAGLLIAAPACATGGYYGAPRDYDGDLERRAYQNGFDRGMRNGARDARERGYFSYERDSDYRDADWGYRRGIERDDYRRAFRQGYQQGYAAGFNRVTRAYGYGSNYPRAGAPYGYPGRPGIYRSPAADIGYRDGLEAGRNDARDRQVYDPIRPKRYREGDHDYDRRYGSRDAYQREYRAAFQQGYQQGYGEYRRNW
jgi:hypothetical protein